MDIKNDCYLRALRRQPIDRSPVWMMRQAGRYLPEYRASRAQAGSFMDLCRNAELACEVTLQPLTRYPDLDAAILFSDILTIPDAMGLELHFDPGQGPVFGKRIRNAYDIAQLKVPDMNTDLGYVMAAVRAIHSALQGSIPLIGFSGSPWTLACYMVEGHGSRDFSSLKSLMYKDPKQAHQLLEILSESVAAYLNAQIAAGAQAIQIFDTWGGLLSEHAYHDFSLRYMAHIIEQLEVGSGDQRIPVVLFTKGGGLWLEAMADSGADGIGLDWTVNLQQAKDRVGHRVALQGNLDPSVLLGSDETICSEVRRIKKVYGGSTGHVFNLGHGITPQVSPEKVSVMLREWRT